LAAALRLPGISPEIAAWHADEYNFVFWPLLILLGEATPPVFYYPHLSYYLLAAANAVHLAFAGTADSFSTSALMRYFWYPEQSLAIARAAGAACAVATVSATARLGRRLGADPRLVAGLLAVCVIHVRQSPVAGADVPMTLFFVLALWAAVRVESAQTIRDYLLVGALVGLAAGCKYQGALVAVALPAVHLASGRPLIDKRLLYAAGGAIGLFLLSTPGALLDVDTFRSGFGELWAHVAPGAIVSTPGWWRHLSLSLWTAYGPAGLALCLLGLVVTVQRRQPAEIALAATFLLYFGVIGSAQLTFVRYALPLTPLAAVLIAIAIRRCGKWAPAAAIAVLGPSLYGSARIADLRLHPDTRVESATWITDHVAPGAVVCNFGGWAGDPSVRTFEDVWWKISQLARSSDTPAVGEALDELGDGPAPVPFVSFVIQTGNQALAPGSLATIENFDCDCVVTHDHALSFSTMAAGMPEDLADVFATGPPFTVDPGNSGSGQSRYDDLDALYIPLSGFGNLRQAGPRTNVLLIHEGVPGNNVRWTARDVFARALTRGARSLVDEEQRETALHLVQQALSSVPDSRDARLFFDAADVFAELGLSAPAEASRQRAVELGEI